MSALRSFALTAAAVLSVVNAAPFATSPLGPSPTATFTDLYYSPNNPSSIPAIVQATQAVDTTCTDSTTAAATTTAAPNDDDPNFYLGDNPTSIPRFTETAAASALSSVASASAFPSLSLNSSEIPAYRKMPIGFAQSGFAPQPTGYSHGHRHGAQHNHGPYFHPHGTAPFPVMPTAFPTAPYPTATAPAPSKPSPTTLYGVNLGGWLILESWMNSDVMSASNATDQYSFDQTTGAEEALQKHWSSYITQDDFKQMSEWGVNAVRIPIGYWAYNNTNTPYIKGADEYLEKAIGWARQYKIQVLVDCHGSPGSQ